MLIHPICCTTEGTIALLDCRKVAAFDEFTLITINYAGLAAEAPFLKVITVMAFARFPQEENQPPSR